MNKIPAKQIYLLSIIVIGLIALSVYSTYALFTFESSTTDIVSIHTPTSLNISENIYEYQQLTIEPNTIVVTEIDIYNTFEYEVCYSLWYKVLGNEDEKKKVQIFQKENSNLQSSGVLTPQTNIKIAVVIINDNDKQVKINLGTTGNQVTEGMCSLNLSEDKNIIKATYDSIETLNNKILDDNKDVKEIKENYMVYKNQKEIITYEDTDKIYISDKFEYKNELFTLTKPTELTLKEFYKEKYLEKQDVYFCKEDKECTILYKLNKIKEIIKEESEEMPEEENNANLTLTPEKEPKSHYEIISYDKLIGYLGGKNGLRKINETDYVFYGDNPNNYIYYNCQNNDNIDTCELWRIIGLYYDKDTEKYNLKIVNNTSIGKYKYNELIEEQEKESEETPEEETITWSKTSLNKYLNEEYKFINNYDIYTYDFKQEIEKYILKEETTTTEKESITSKINLLTLSDFLNTSSCDIKLLTDIKEECINNNWLNNIELDQIWTMTQIEKTEKIIEEEITTETPEEIPTENVEENTDNNVEDNEDLIDEPIETPEEEPIIEKEITTNYAYSIGKEILETEIDELLEVRPTLYLKSRMLVVGGEGTFEKPYIIK